MRIHATALVVALLAVAHASPLAAQRHTLAGDDVAIYNLAGTITVTGAASGDVVATVTPRGSDADRLRIETGRVAGRNTLRVLADGDDVVFPALGRGSRSTLQVARDGTFFDLGVTGRRVTITGGGSGVEAYADVAVTVPPGRTVRLHAGVGSVEVRNVSGNVHVRTSSARSEVSDIRGSLELRTSSGGATVDGVDGTARIQSSSGGLRVTNLRGSVQQLQSSSGSIQATNVTGDVVRMAASSGTITGDAISGSDIELNASSGSIRIDGMRATSVEARTSSGSIRLRELSAARVDVTASSGSIELSADAALTSLSARTNSGRVSAALPRGFGGDVEIRTRSGTINTDLPVTTTTMRRNELIGRIGSGTGSLRIQTGSGSVRITAR